MKAGTPEQEAYLVAEMARNPGDLKAAPYNGDHYKWAVGKLKAAGLYRVPHPIKATEWLDTPGTPAHRAFVARSGGAVMYYYGSEWLYFPIPADVVEQIKRWGDNSDGLSFYDRQAADFLSANGIKFRANLAATQKPAPFAEAGEKCGNHYRVTLSGKARRLTFSFWGSIKDAEEGKPVTAYSILACISNDANTPETFADFCSEYGYDSDSIKARDTFKRCALFARRLRAFFTEAELQGLAEIQ
jgi:hypothetical protein